MTATIMRRAWLPLLALVSSARADMVVVAPPQVPDEPAVRAMRDELARSLAQLQLEGFAKPYLLTYELDDSHHTTVEASFGALLESNAYPSRSVSIDLHVGDYALDNTNFASSERFGDRSVSVTVDNDYDAVRRALWLATDHVYKRAVETLEHKRAVIKSETKNADDVGSYSKESIPSTVNDRPSPNFDRAQLEGLAKKLSAVFRTNPDIQVGWVAIHASTGREIFLSSEGSESLQTGAFLQIIVDCETQADDGMPLHDQITWFDDKLDSLPSEADMLAQVDKLSKRMSALRRAPVVDDYGGPVVFDDLAAPQLVRALLVDQLAGTPAVKTDRPGAHDDASVLAGKIGQRVLPLGTSVTDDPTVQRISINNQRSIALAGATHFDDEGVPTQRVTLIENGVFKGFLMSRIPRKGFEHSNGHGIATSYSAPRAHPMNVMLYSKRGVSDGELRRQAFAAAKDQGLKYVLFVDKLSTGRSSRDDADSGGAGIETVPRPTVMRRVYLDGHEELVRGGRFGELPLHELKDMIAVGSTTTVYTYSAGYYAAVASPPLLLRDIDVKKPTGTHRKLPIAPRPH
jgi:TldD protein